MLNNRYCKEDAQPQEQKIHIIGMELSMENLKEPLLQMVTEIPFFDCFEKTEISLLLDAGNWLKVTPGNRIITKDEIDLRMFVLIQGNAEVVLQEKTLAVLNDGDIFGEFGLMGVPRIAHVEAQTDCLLLSFTAEQLNKLPLELQVKFLRRILLALFARLQKINQRDWLRRHPKKDAEKMFHSGIKPDF